MCVCTSMRMRKECVFVHVWECARDVCMGWLWLVGSFKLYVSFAEDRLFYRALLQRRPIIVRSLLTKATPYENVQEMCVRNVLDTCSHVQEIHTIMSHTFKRCTSISHTFKKWTCANLLNVLDTHLLNVQEILIHVHMYTPNPSGLHGTLSVNQPLRLRWCAARPTFERNGVSWLSFAKHSVSFRRKYLPKYLKYLQILSNIRVLHSQVFANPLNARLICHPCLWAGVLYSYELHSQVFSMRCILEYFLWVPQTWAKYLQILENSTYMSPMSVLEEQTTGLSCRPIGLFCRPIGLFCRPIGLFCRPIGNTTYMSPMSVSRSLAFLWVAF